MSLKIIPGAHGTIECLQWDSQTVPFCRDSYAGPSFHVVFGGKGYDSRGEEHKIGDNSYEMYCWGCMIRYRFYAENELCHIAVTVENRSAVPFMPESFGMYLGADSYMDDYPSWNGKYFPTFARCERTHFYGYMASPLGKYLGIASPDPVASWALEYKYFPFVGGGHRIYTMRLDLLCREPLPDHHPRLHSLAPHETRTWDIVLFSAENADSVLKKASLISGAPVFSGERLNFAIGEPRTLRCYSPACPTVNGEAFMQDGDAWKLTLPSAEKSGEEVMDIVCRSRSARIRVYTRNHWSWYLENAAKEALTAPQKTGSHAESWYGLYTGLLADRFLHHGEKSYFAKELAELIPLAFDPVKGIPVLIPGRIQNTATLVGLAADAYEATGDESWLDLGTKFADHLMNNCQTEDGVYRNGDGGHYTSVIYIAKSMMEFAAAEAGIPARAEASRRHFQSAKRACDELVLHLDNIGTEGEATFEDGMISCSMTQIAMAALYLPETERDPYIQAAETLLAKHRCLERLGSPDCRNRSTTCRFWEAQYDVLIPTNMMNSPHGWTAWKIYGTWYLYLLTGKKSYLIDTVETLSSCVQLLSPEGELRWSFVTDPQIQTAVLKEDPEKPGVGKYVLQNLGEEYIPMISHWYRTPKGKAAFDYIWAPYPGFEIDDGGCCDNDVHECFKAMVEVAMPWAYLDTTENTQTLVNARFEKDILIPDEKIVRGVYVNLDAPRSLTVRFSGGDVTATLRRGWIYADGTTGEGLPRI